jgi:hypothetical protein
MTGPETARSTGRGPQCHKPVEASAADRAQELAPTAPAMTTSSARATVSHRR